MRRPISVRVLIAGWRKTLSLCTAILLVSSPSRPVQAQSGSADEYALRAAMLLNLTKFIEWPAWKVSSLHPTFLVCILGHDPIEPYTDRYLQHQTILNKPVQLKSLKDLSDAADCHILYISTGGKHAFEHSAANLSSAGVLSVSEQAVSHDSPQILGLPLDNDHVHIGINLSAAQSAGFAVSSRLLHLATVMQ